MAKYFYPLGSGGVLTESFSEFLGSQLFSGEREGTSTNLYVHETHQSLYEIVNSIDFSKLEKSCEEIAGILEWGFEEIEWKLDQLGGTLKSIDKTLKNPGKVEANEKRKIAEELRLREVFDEAEQFFLESLKANPLDYRTYISLGKCYAQTGKNNKARTFFEKSFPHAPKGRIDYKSYTCRLLGRLDFCEDNFQQAAKTLRKAVGLSPNYYLGHYDYAQYSALIRDKANCLNSLKIATENEPVPIELIRRERNFKPLRNEIEAMIKSLDFDKINFRAKLKKMGWRVTSLVEEAETKYLETKQQMLRTYSKKGIESLLAKLDKLDKYLKKGPHWEEVRIPEDIYVPNHILAYSYMSLNYQNMLDAIKKQNVRGVVQKAISIIDEAEICLGFYRKELGLGNFDVDDLGVMMGAYDKTKKLVKKFQDLLN